jgi:hypothetical protein
MEIYREWDLITDGILWRETLAAFSDDPEMSVQAEKLVNRLQQGADRSCPIQFIVYDQLASNHLRRIAITRFQSAHIRLGKKRSLRSWPGKDPADQQLLLSCANVPHGDVMDICVKVETMLDSQKIKNLRLLLQLEASVSEQEPNSGPEDAGR